MSEVTIGMVGMVVLTVLIFLRVPVAIALGIVGFAGYAILQGFGRATAVLGNIPFELTNYALSVVPLFVLMGALSTTAGLSRDLFRAANILFGGLRGSLALAAVAASAGFGAVCGSSLATAATMGRVSIPEMLASGYSPRLAAGTVAAGGTLGILIPPSLILIIYAIITQQSVALLFAAALIPGLILTALYVGVVLVICAVRPNYAPVLPRPPASEAVVAVLRTWHIVVLFLLTIGGIYLGWYSPNEAAAIGCFGALVLGLALRRLAAKEIKDSFNETIELTASLFLVVMGAIMFSYFVVQTKISVHAISLLNDYSISPLMLISLVIVFYIILGCFLEGIGMILVTVPVIYPIVVAAGFDPAWFGILLVIVVEIGLIHPPMGMNLFVIRAQSKEISVPDLYMGVLPFLIAPLILIVLMICFPQIVLWLPQFLNK